MSKLIYEKPDMLIEGFVATQSVAAACGDINQDFPAIAIDLTQKTSLCKCTKDSPKEGHYFDLETLKSGMGDNYDSSWEADGKIVIFNDSDCELIYNNPPVNGDVVTLGILMTGNKSWKSNQHAMIINGVNVPS